MAAGTTTEILMQFVPESGRALEAECNTVLTGADKLANLTVSGFANGFEQKRYFLVDTFKFGIALSDSETEARNKALKGLADIAAGKPVPPHVHAHVQKHLANPQNAASAQVQSFARWRSATDDSWKRKNDQQPYNPKIDEFSFTRRIDKSSIVLFDYCCKQKSFPYASLVKRKSAPVPHSDLPSNQSYLRIDFKDVMISSLKLSDDDVVEETCTFHAKSMRIQYWAEAFEVATQTDGVLSYLNTAKWVRTVVETAPSANS